MPTVPPAPAAAPAAAPAHPTAPPAPLWRVTSQELDQAFPTSGEPYDEWTIYFVTRSGVKGYVKIPAEMYSAAHVGSAIHPVAEAIEHVAGLHGS